MSENGNRARRSSRLRWSRVWFVDAAEGTLARHEDREVLRTGGRWIDVESGEEVDVSTSAD
jgi:hypothetical protein